MRKKINEIANRAATVVQQYPMVLTMAFIAALSTVIFIDLGRLNSREESQNFGLIKLLLTGCLGISLMFAIKMASQRFGRRPIMELLGVGLLALFYTILPDTEKDFTEMYLFIVFPVFILSHLLVSFAPFIGGRHEHRFWTYNNNLFLNLISTAVFTGVLTGGILLAILAVDNLFDIDITEHRYSQIAFFFLIFGSCFTFLLFSGNGLYSLEKDSEYPQILKFFTQFVLIPLLLVYLAILYVYSTKILIAWELPKGWVSYLVLAYAVVGILAQLLIHPLKKDTSRSWVRVFSNVFYYTLLPLLALLFTAIFTRILEYGYTEARYFVLLLALWLTTVVLYFILSKRDNIKFIPISLFVFGVFALIFPYFNALATSKRSQKQELEEVLNQNQLLHNGKIDFNKQINDTVAKEISDKFSFLANRKEEHFLLEFVSESSDLKHKILNKNLYNIRNSVHDSFSNVVEKNDTETPTEGFQMVSRLRVLPVSDYDYSVSLLPYEEAVLPFSNEVVSINSESTDIYKINLQSATKKVTSYNLMPYLKQISEQHKNQEGRFEVPEITHEFELGDYRMKACIREVSYFENKNNTNITPRDLTLLIRKK